MVQVFTIPFPSVCNLCSFSQIFASCSLHTLQTWLVLSSYWYDYLEELCRISFWVGCFQFHSHAFQLLMFIHSELPLYLRYLYLDISSYLCLLLQSFPSLLWKSHQISISFFTTWCIQSFLWLLPAGLSWYLPVIFCGYLILCSLQCRKPVGRLCCKLHCFHFLEFLEIQRQNAVLSLSVSQSWLSVSPWATDDLCRSLLLDTCDNSSSLFSIFVQLRCSLSDSGCRHQKRSRYTATLDDVWTWYWLEPTHAPSRNLLAAHRLQSFLLSYTAQPQTTLQTVLFCWLWHCSRPLRAARPPWGLV